ncbi:hypothetical protein NCC49_000937 [Naganishia albida]|nr:hypothetical protein NCC49_000937 [Naganishia albida]
MFWKKSSQRSRGAELTQAVQKPEKRDRVVTAHFMLGNTYPYVAEDWQENFRLAEETGIDAFALNLGPEPWQLAQARSAYRICSARKSVGGTDSKSFKLFLSLDMNVLPSATREDMLKLVNMVEELGRVDCQLSVTRRHASNKIWDEDTGEKIKKIVLSTFGGGQADFGGRGWLGFLHECKARGLNVYFIPSFFLPPETILDMPFVDATFNWNGGWPAINDTINTEGDEVFIRDRRPYMAAVSPWFFTHYGTTGPWAWNKNWIYRSDDNLYASRWQQILDDKFDPEFVQLISWNDYGESHYIGPILGAQPGSEAWTKNRDHDAWRLMTKYFVERYKGLGRSNPEDVEVWLPYRTHTKDLDVPNDEVGRPEHADWSQDVIAVSVLLPEHRTDSSWSVEITAGEGDQYERKVVLDRTSDLQTFLVPFSPGQVSFQVKEGAETVLEGEGESITDIGTERYNFNAWTGHWSRKVS